MTKKVETFFDSEGKRLTETEIQGEITGEISGTREELTILSWAIGIADLQVKTMTGTASIALKAWADRIQSALKDIEHDSNRLPFEP